MMLTKLLMMALSAATPKKVSCLPIQEVALEHHINAVAQSAPSENTEGPILDLSDYWHERCLRSRKGASESQVRRLATLLSIPSARLVVSSLLFDVDGNLKFASGAINAALLDQMSLEKKQKDEVYPFIPSRYSSISPALRCLKRKSLDGIINPRLCRYLDLKN